MANTICFSYVRKRREKTKKWTEDKEREEEKIRYWTTERGTNRFAKKIFFFSTKKQMNVKAKKSVKNETFLIYLYLKWKRCWAKYSHDWKSKNSFQNYKIKWRKFWLFDLLWKTKKVLEKKDFCISWRIPNTVVLIFSSTLKVLSFFRHLSDLLSCQIRISFSLPPYFFQSFSWQF